MNPHLAYRRAAAIGRVFLMVASLLGACLLIVWVVSPATIDSVDAALRQRHLAPHERRLEEVESAEQQGDYAGAISLLEEAREDLGPVLKSDRLDPLKRQTLSRLAHAYRAASRQEEAFDVLDEWSAFDSRDLRPLILRASWQGPAGIDSLLELHTQFRRATVLTPLEEQLAVALLDHGREVDALVLAADLLAEPPDRHWQVLWDDGGGFRVAASMSITATIDDAGGLGFAVSVPGDARRLRIDAPASSILVLDLSLHLEGRGPAVTIPLSDVTPRAQVRNVGERVLEMVGTDPRVVVAVPPSLHGAERLDVQVSGSVMRAPPPRLTGLLASVGAAATIDILEARGDTERASRLRRVRKWIRGADSEPAGGEATDSRRLSAILLDQGRVADALALAADTLAEPPPRSWQVFWDDGDGFRAASSLNIAATVDDSGALSFDASLPGDAQRLRVDAPVSSIIAHDLSLRLEGRGSPVEISLSTAKPRQQVRNVGERTLEMAGDDPRIVVQVPASLRGAERLRARVSGWVMSAPAPRLIELLAGAGAGRSIDNLERRGETERARLLRRVSRWLHASGSTPPGEASEVPR